MATKVCRNCREEKDTSEFWSVGGTKKHILRSYCKTCGKKYNDHSKYKLTFDAREQMFLEQEGLCLICKKEDSLVVDHNHSTGKVRGLLCSSCNTGIGLLGDNPSLLETAANYLREGE